MKKSIFAVCDLEVDYALNFMDYIIQKRNIPFEVQAFTTAEKLISYSKENYIELLLISGKAMRREIRELNIGKVIILSEGVHSPELDQYPSVYKYQSSSDVIREVMSYYGSEKSKDSTEYPILKKATQIIGIYSPLHRCLKTSFALTLGQILAKEKAVLYLNLEEYSGFEEMMGKTYAGNLSDLLYYVRQENSSLIHKVNSMVQTVNNLDFIPPVKTPSDIRGTPWKDWETLITELERGSAYEYIILDIGDGIDELYQMLDKCKNIYMPVLSDSISLCKIKQFENLMRVWDMSHILAKIEKVKLPFYVECGRNESYVEQLVWTELGDYVRNTLRKGQNE